ncbi:MAG: Eco57I restriction-modification methylase domain-containing protein [Prosthecobacter sp.]|uniref:Eco57I restriction-modification methylase domain-containing protein n=1 Tax=Prosthecobacter sp. TaxID=1965333 RepID=UPI0038FFD2E7
MTRPATEALDRLAMHSDESGLVRVLKGAVATEYEKKIAKHPYQGRLRRLVQEASGFGADYVYFRLYPDTGAPRAEVFIFDRTSPTAVVNNAEDSELQLKLWNYGQVPLMFVLCRDGVDIRNLLTKPELDELGVPKLSPFEKLNLAADTAAEIEQDKWDRYNAHRFDNGTFWNKDNPLLNDAETSIKALVNEVRIARLEVERRTEKWNNPALAKRLMIFAIIVRFLEERGILTDDYFRRANGDATRFEDIVGRPGTLANVLGKLEHDLNGDVFRLRPGVNGEPSEREQIERLEADDLAPIADFATGQISSGQKHLWKLYRFDHLPVEAMSYIYEDFLGGEDNAYYTPQLLAELLLDEAMEPDRVVEALRNWEPGKDAPYRLIDPSCGSGVFLVGAWRRLVEAWRVLHKNEKPGIEVLSALMKQNIYGVDIKPDAIDLTCFSLSVALCAELMRDAKDDNPSVLDDLQNHKLPSLKAGLHGNNLFSRDFFEQLEGGLPHAGQFSLVIGNPPFDAVASAIADRVATAPSPGLPEIVAWPSGVPGNQICYHFLREAPRLLKEGGIACLIQKDAFLYNLGPEEFRSVLFRNWRVPQILDFISVRHLFDAAKTGGGKVDTKVVAVFIEAVPPREDDVITHVTFRKVSAVEQRLFFEVDAYDIHRVPVDVAMTDPKVWKANLLGGGRLLQTYHSVKGTRTIESFLKSKDCIDHRPDTRTKDERDAQPDVDYDGKPIPANWFCSEGFWGENGGKYRPLRKEMIYVDTDSFPLIPTGEKGSDRSGLEYFGAPRDFAIFSPPHLLIKQHESLPFVFRGSENSQPLLFRKQIVSIACPKHDEGELKSLADYLCREQAHLPFFVAFGARYMVNKQSALLKQDIMELPYPQDGKLHFRGIEPTLRDDVLQHMIPLIKYGTGKPETAHLVKPASKQQLQSFSRSLIKVLRHTWKEICESQITDLGTAWCVAYSLDGSNHGESTTDGETREQLIARLDALLEHRSSAHLRFRRVVRMFDDETLYLIKPKDYRYWLQSVAVRDADEVVGSLTAKPKQASRLTEVSV